MSQENKSAIQITGVHWAMASHLVPFIGCAIPFFNIIAPYLIFKILKPSEAFAKDHARASTNFQITYMVMAIIAASIYGLLVLILTQLSSTANTFAFVIPVALFSLVFGGYTILSLVALIQNTIRASKEMPPRYFHSWNFVKAEPIKLPGE